MPLKAKQRLGCLSLVTRIIVEYTRCLNYGLSSHGSKHFTLPLSKNSKSIYLGEEFMLEGNPTIYPGVSIYSQTISFGPCDLIFQYV